MKIKGVTGEGQNLFIYDSWIANFGVLPLFRFLAFRLFPCFFNLLARRIRVTFVFDAIISLWFSFAAKILFLSLLGQLFFVNESSLLAQSVLPSWTLGIGEQRELKMKGVTQYSIGNKNILSVKLLKSRPSLLIKGKGLGATDVFLTDSKGHNRSLKIFVISRPALLKMEQTKEILTDLGLGHRTVGDQVTAFGELHTLEHLKAFQKLQAQNKTLLAHEVQMNHSLKRALIARAYLLFFHSDLQRFRCTVEGPTLLCKVQDVAKVPQHVRQEVLKELGGHILPYQEALRENYRLRLKIFQWEKVMGEELALGLESLIGTLEDLFEKNFEDIVKKNQWLLESEGLSLKTLATPDLLLSLGKEATIRLGEEIPYRSSGHHGGGRLSWKFAGLKLKIKLERARGRFLVSYQVELTRESGESLSGPWQSAQVLVDLSRPKKLFQINYHIHGLREEKLPFLGQIPFIGTLFTAPSKTERLRSIQAALLIQPDGRSF